MTFDAGLRSTFQKNLSQARWTPVEPGATVLGVPGSEYCFSDGQQGWVEHRRCRGDRVEITLAQVRWLTRRRSLGGRAFVAVRKDDELILFDGEVGRDLRTKKVSEVASLSSWRGGPGGWNWIHVEHYLRFQV